MPPQILNNFGVVPVLPQQSSVAVAESVPAFQRNAERCSDGLDVELYPLGHPAGLLPFHPRTGEDVLSLSSARRFLPPRERFNNQIIIVRNLLLRVPPN